MGKRPFGSLRIGWQDIIKINYIEAECESVDWTHLSQDKTQRWAIYNTLMNCRSMKLIYLKFKNLKPEANILIRYT